METLVTSVYSQNGNQFINTDHSPHLDWGFMLCGALNKILHLILRGFWLS